MKSLWRSVTPGGYLVFAEVGTPVGFHLTKFVRDAILHEDLPGRVVAPCPHQFECQMDKHSWCHFKQRVFLLYHERTKTKTGETKSFRDISYSYVIIQKPNILPGTIPFPFTIDSWKIY